VEIPTPVSEIISRLHNRWGIDALWIFGSRATGSERPDSDWDLAALFRSRPDPAELFELRGEFELIVGAPVDLVDLERASPVLARQVAKFGQLIVENNRRRRIDFIAHVPGRYEDLCIVRRAAERSLIERIRHG
jgi:uncharacterized protein